MAMAAATSELLCTEREMGSQLPDNAEKHPSEHDSTNNFLQIAADTVHGCVMGRPVATGHPATPVPNEPFVLDVAIMRSIQADNYKFIRHMIITGWTPAHPTACSFHGQREVWQVRQATPLHYAVCCGSLQAAAALLIAFPELVDVSCKVETSSDSTQREATWTALDLTSFFGNLYMSLDQERHVAYQQASLVLLHMKQNARRFAFMQHDSAKDRLEAAGKNPQEVTAAILEALG